MGIAQTVILVNGCITIYLISEVSNKRKLWGFAIGFLTQPFWIYDCFMDGDYGILTLSFFYAFSYAKGYITHRKRVDREVGLRKIVFKK